MSLFGRLFGAVEGGEILPPGIAVNPAGAETTQEFLQLAIELIDEFVPEPNAVWESNSDNLVADEDFPFIVGKPERTDFAVKILFDRDKLEDRQLLRYLKDTALVQGQVNGWMYPYEGFTPKLKDTVRFNNQTFGIRAIDPVMPIDYPIIYFIEFSS